MCLDKAYAGLDLVARGWLQALFSLTIERAERQPAQTRLSQTQIVPMSDVFQLDLFDRRPDFDRPANAVLPQPLRPQELTDERLIAVIPEATLADGCAMAAEAGKRRLAPAIPALVSLCNRFAGYGIDVGVPEQAAALEALGAIGGSEASSAVVQLIARRIVLGPTLVVAIAIASQLRVIFPTEIALAFLRDSNPTIRALACACVRAGYEVVSTLLAMLDDPDGDVSAAAACALGRMGRGEARAHLKRLLAERPSTRGIEALAAVADDDAIVLLARLGRARPDLAASILSALEDIDNARAASSASALRRFLSETERRP